MGISAWASRIGLGMHGESEPTLGADPDQIVRVQLVQLGGSTGPREWRKYGAWYLVHMFTGAVAAAGMIVSATSEPIGIVPFAGVTGLVMVRQTVEFLKRRDTPGRDLGDHLTGYVFGLGVGIVLVAADAPWGLLD